MNLVARIQRIDWLRPSVIALMLADLVPLAGVFLFHWEVFPLLFLFWLENVIIGAVNVAKMILASGSITSGLRESDLVNQALQERLEQMKDSPDPTVQAEIRQLDGGVGRVIGNVMGWAMKLFLVPFFCFHYGMFTFVHGIFLMTLFGGHEHLRQGDLNGHLILQVIGENHLLIPFLALAAGHVVSFAYDYVWRGEFRRTNVMMQMSQPYSRVLMMHLTILFGGFLMMTLRSPAVGLALLVVLKLAFDLVGHQREREKFGASDVDTAG